MNKLLLALCLTLACPLAPVACNSTPSARVTEYQTLKTVGLAVDASMKVAAQLVADGKITRTQWEQIAAVHARFQQGFKLALSAVQSDLTLASPDLIRLAGEVMAVVTSYQKP